jgi:hypothetical protein
MPCEGDKAVRLERIFLPSAFAVSTGDDLELLLGWPRVGVPLTTCNKSFCHEIWRLLVPYRGKFEVDSHPLEGTEVDG